MVYFAWDYLAITNLIFSLFIILLVYGALLFVFLKVTRRTTPFIFIASTFILFMFSFIFYLEVAMVLISFVTAAGATVMVIANQGDFNKFLANPFKRIVTKSGNFGVEKIFDSSDLYKKVEKAVLTLSKSKTGAIITFEKNKALNPFLRNGVSVNAPLTPELLCTIFYPGTRLHDGAVIVHGNEIIAAAVFFTLTTQPFAVKYGSRHRAAIGISEVSDAITVVVSEETGRISIAVNGTLEPVDQDNFLNVFETYMTDSSIDE